MKEHPPLVLIDGEHYPPVVRDALRQLRERYEFRAALFLGGAEKIDRAGLKEKAEGLYGLPVVFADESAGGWRPGWKRPSTGTVRRWSLTSVTNRC